MSPADCAVLAITPEAATLTPELAIILPGGRTLLAFSHLRDVLPPSGSCADAPWQASCWPLPGGRAGLALVQAPLAQAGRLQGPDGAEIWIAAPRGIDVTPGRLAEFVNRHGLNGRDIFDFLTRMLTDASTGEMQPGDRQFVSGFLAHAVEADGFVEILAFPDTGGLFAQGWAMSLAAGRHRLARMDGLSELCEADVAVFSRDDIMPPGVGFCLFSLDWRGAELDTLDCLFYEQDGRLKRLEIVRGTVLRLQGEAASDHVRQMLPRLAGDGKAVGTHRRICRPRFRGVDTLTSTPLPVAAAFDGLFQAPSGALLAMGWLLDPLRRVERIIVKSTAGLYAPLQESWNALPRADLNDGFSGDPRFARLLDDSDSMHGFIAYASGRPPQEGEDFYLELVLDDGGCLFHPLKVTALGGREMLPRILAAVPLHDPALGTIVESALAPFLGDLPAIRRKPPATQRPLTLSAQRGEITAVIPLDRMDHLQPIMAMLSGTPEAERLDLMIVMARGNGGDAATRLKDLFAFYELRGRLLLVADKTSQSARIEAGLAMAAGPRVLLWSPAALPATPGWLELLEADMQGLGVPGLISPTLVYEDGSIFCGGEGGAADDTASMLGYPLNWMKRGTPRPMPSGAAQIALIDRAALTDAGGFSGQLYSDAMAHRDLARRLHERGFGTWSSPSVDFWMLEDKTNQKDAMARLLETIDSALLGHTAPILAGDRIQ